MRIAIILYGPPGSGKGTQGEFLEKEGYAPYIMGNLLRKEAEKNEKIKQILISGGLVDDSTVIKILKDNFNSEEKVLFDGFPRTLSQAKLLYPFLIEKGYKIINLIIDTPEAILIERITLRYYCPKCGATYHIKYHPPKTPGKCDNDGTKLIRRSDDTPETLKIRLAKYNSNMSDIEDYIKTLNLPVYHIDGSKSIDEVHKKIKKLLEAEVA